MSVYHILSPWLSKNSVAHMHETAAESDTALRSSVLVLFGVRDLQYGLLKAREKRESKIKTLFFFYHAWKLFCSEKMNKLLNTNSYVLSETLLSHHLLESSGCFEMEFVVFKVQLPWKSL